MNSFHVFVLGQLEEMSGLPRATAAGGESKGLKDLNGRRKNRNLDRLTLKRISAKKTALSFIGK